MYADKYGTPAQQHLWHIDYLRPTERTGAEDKGKACKNCRFLSTINPGTRNKKILCQYGPNLRVLAGAICKHYKKAD